MMTSPILLQLAKQGNAIAIAALMNAALKTEAIQVKVRLDEPTHLQVMVRSPQWLNQHATIAFIRRGMVRLGADCIQEITTYAWKTGEDFPHWIAHFHVAAAAPEPVPVQSASVPPLELESLVRQGDSLAIALKLNRITRLQGIATRAAVKEGCLHILLESEQVPDRETAIDLVTAELARLRVEHLDTIKLYGRQKGHRAPQWMHPLPPEEIQAVAALVLEEGGEEVLEEVLKEVGEEVVPPVTPEALPEPAPIQPEESHRGSPVIPDFPTIPEPAPVPLEIAEPGSPALVDFPPLPEPALAGMSRAAGRSPKRTLTLTEVSFALAMAVVVYFMMAGA